MYYSIHIIQHICIKFRNKKMYEYIKKYHIFITNIILNQAVITVNSLRSLTQYNTKD